MPHECTLSQLSPSAAFGRLGGGAEYMKSLSGYSHIRSMWSKARRVADSVSVED